MPDHDIIVIGAGPAGLATAIAAKKAGLSAVVLEKAALVNTLLHFPVNMVYYTTPELMEIGGLPFTTPYEKPTRPEALRYYRRVADAYDLAIRYDEHVMAVESANGASAGEGAFIVRSRHKDGALLESHGRFVVIASGAYDRPNGLGVPGEDLPHVAHYYTEAHPYFRKRVVIVGGANSAADAALELYRSGVDVTIVHRARDFSRTLKYWVRPDLENRVKEGSIRALMETRVVEIRRDDVEVEGPAGRDTLAADAVFLLTGYVSDTTLLAASGVRFDPETTIPAFDLETLETNVPGIFLAGAVTTGRNSGKIFIENGRFHGERVVEVIRGRAGK